MNDALKMQISAFVDGELPDNESELLLRRLSQDAALRRQAALYLEIGRLMRRDRELPGVRELRGRVATALGEQAVESLPEASGRSTRFMKPLAGFAIAASVAVLALVGLRQVNLPGPPEVPAVAGLDDGVRAITEPAIDDLQYEPVDDELLDMHQRHAKSSMNFGSNSRLRELVNHELELEWRDGKWVEVEPDEHSVGDQDADGAAGTADASPGDAAGTESRRVN